MLEAIEGGLYGLIAGFIHLHWSNPIMIVIGCLLLYLGIKKGFEIIVSNFKKILSEEGVEPMNSEGEKFDPYKHEVVMVEEEREDLPENTIIEELEKGYYFNNKVLRPAKVKISKKSKLPNLEENQVKIKIENKN